MSRLIDPKKEALAIFRGAANRHTRRSLLKAGIAAPFISRMPAILMGHLGTAGTVPGGGGGGTDPTVTVLAALGTRTWSGDQVAAGYHTDEPNPVRSPIVTPQPSSYGASIANNNDELKFPGDSTDWGTGTTPNGQQDFAFSSGTWMPGQKAYGLIAAGGHTNTQGAPVRKLDFSTGTAVGAVANIKWAVTEHSPQLRTGTPDPGTVVTTDGNTIYSWPNIQGHRGNWMGHIYGAAWWGPGLGADGLGRGGAYSGRGYLPATFATFGSYLYDKDCLWDQSSGQAATPNGTWNTALFIPGLNKVFCAFGNQAAQHVGSPQVGSAGPIVFDPITAAYTQPCNTGTNDADKLAGDRSCTGVFVQGAHASGSSFLDFIHFQYNDTTKACIIPSVNDPSKQTTHATTSVKIAFGNSVPASIDPTNCVWIDWMGNYKSGSPYILVADTANGTGIYRLHKDTLVWDTSPLVGSAFPAGCTVADIAGPSSGNKIIQVMTDYVVPSAYVPIVMIRPINGAAFLYNVLWSDI